MAECLAVLDYLDPGILIAGAFIAVVAIAMILVSANAEGRKINERNRDGR